MSKVATSLIKWASSTMSNGRCRVLRHRCKSVTQVTERERAEKEWQRAVGKFLGKIGQQIGGWEGGKGEVNRRNRQLTRQSASKQSLSRTRRAEEDGRALRHG